MEKSSLLEFLPKKTITNLSLLFFGLICWILSVYNQLIISDYYGCVSVRYNEPVISKQMIKNAKQVMKDNTQTDIPEVTLWKRTQNIKVCSQITSTDDTVDLITAAGDISRIFPNARLHGSYVYEEDYFGCLIDRKTAYELFHSEDVTGLCVTYMNREYIIRGVMDIPDYQLMVIQADDRKTFNKESDYAADYKGTDNGQTPESDIKFNCMELQFSNTRNTVNLAKEFVLNHGLGNPSVYINGYLSQKLSNRIILFPMWYFAIWIILKCIRKVYSLRGSLILFITGIFLLLILCIILIKIVDLHIYYPADMIPGKWSDFDFWVNQWKNFRSSIITKNNVIQYYKDILLNRVFLNTVAGSILAVIFESIFIIRLNMESK